MEFISNSPHKTVFIGSKIGKMLKKGHIVCLYGDLGSGKTTLIKGIAINFGLSERDVTSASFTIISEYDSLIPFYHIDLYRLDDISSIEDTGLYEYLSGEGVAVIEWAEKVRGFIECNISIKIEYLSAEKRKIIIEGINEKDWDNF